MSNGFAWAKEGKDAASTDYRDLVWATWLNAFSVWKIGVLDIPYTAGSGAAAGTLAHGLGFTPAFLAFGEFGVGQIFQPSATFPPFSGAQLAAWTDGTNLHIAVDVALGSANDINQTFHCPYVIFGDVADGSLSFTNAPNVNPVGMKFVKPGKDVDSPYLEDLIFSTDYPPLKIVTSGQASHAVGAHAAVETLIPHGLPHVPMFYALNSGVTGLAGEWRSTPVFVIGDVVCFAYADATNVHLRTVNSTAGTFTSSWRYMIFAEKTI